MHRFRLRHGPTELELPQGEFVIGRGTQCHLTLDDPLISRRHARIVLEGDALFIEDLGSRNGYVLNGTEFRDRRPLRHLDRVRIGNADLTLVDEQASAAFEAARQVICKVCGRPALASHKVCAYCGNPIAQVREHATMEIMLPPEMRRTVDSSRAPSAFALVGGIASKALALGRVEEAERVIGTVLDQILGRMEAGDAGDAASFKETLDFAVKLLDGPGGGRWVSYILRMHAATRRVPDAGLVDQLHEVARRTRFSDPRPIDRALEVLHANPGLTAAERFVVKRIEALRRVVSA